MIRNYIPKHKTPFLPIRWMYRFDRHNFYWACHFSRRYHRLKNKERYARRLRARKELNIILDAVLEHFTHEKVVKYLKQYAIMQGRR